MAAPYAILNRERDTVYPNQIQTAHPQAFPPSDVLAGFAKGSDPW